MKISSNCSISVFFTLMLCLLLTAQAEPAIDRLIYSPAQRDAMESPATSTSASTDNSAGKAPLGASALSFDGVVTRSDGKSTAWINGESYRFPLPAGKSEPFVLRGQHLDVGGLRGQFRLAPGQRNDQPRLAIQVQPQRNATLGEAR